MSPFVLVTSTGPDQHATVGAITLRVFPDRGGPTTIAALCPGERNTPPSARPAHTCHPAVPPSGLANHSSTTTADETRGSSRGRAGATRPSTDRQAAAHTANPTSNKTTVMASADRSDDQDR